MTTEQISDLLRGRAVNGLRANDRHERETIEGLRDAVWMDVFHRLDACEVDFAINASLAGTIAQLAADAVAARLLLDAVEPIGAESAGVA